MSNITDARRVAQMYVENDTLSTRLSLHERYSVNRYGWANWVFDQYTFAEGVRVLELACGTAAIWKNRGPRLPGNRHIVLSDISPTMVAKARDLLSGCNGFSFERIDIQDIPHADASFDVVIANHMLYHVPDKDRALAEVRRVLKPGGRFYCTTIGKHTLKELQPIYRKLEGKACFSYSENVSFTLENGDGLLRRFFSQVERRDYLDALEVTDVDDLMAYIQSYNEVPDAASDELRALVKEGFSADGVFRISKEQGMFICHTLRPRQSRV